MDDRGGAAWSGFAELACGIYSWALLNLPFSNFDFKHCFGFRLLSAPEVGRRLQGNYPTTGSILWASISMSSIGSSWHIRDIDNSVKATYMVDCHGT